MASKYTLEEIINIKADVLDRVIQNFEVRLRKVYSEEGWHIETILS
jgi:hypothetical protein